MSGWAEDRPSVGSAHNWASRMTGVFSGSGERLNFEVPLVCALGVPKPAIALRKGDWRLGERSIVAASAKWAAAVDEGGNSKNCDCCRFCVCGVRVGIGVVSAERLLPNIERLLFEWCMGFTESENRLLRPFPPSF